MGEIKGTALPVYHVFREPRPPYNIAFILNALKFPVTRAGPFLALQLDPATGIYFKPLNVGKVVLYVIYGTRAVVSCLIQHSASPRAVSATRPHPSCHKSRKALLTYIK